jgi:peroxiredoxin
MFPFLFSSCKKADTFTVNGLISGAQGDTVYFENVGVSNVLTLDSVILSSNGKFEFKNRRPEYPDFYRLRLKNQLINFVVDSTETVTITADEGAFATSYSVEGSKESKDIKDITLAQLDANQSINKLRKDLENGLVSDSEYRKSIIEAANAYKTTALNLIYKAPMSMASYFALFQQVNGLLFFDLYDRNDLKAFGAVATSFKMNYPDSPRAKQLESLTLQSMKVMRAMRPKDLSEVKTDEVSYFDIDLPSIDGQKIKLSEVAKDKSVLINFTAYQTEWSPALNMTLVDLYNKYHDKGFEIYQVSLDADMHLWKNISSKLPWVKVYDPEYAYSQIAALYNVRQLPAIFLLNKKGDLVKRVEKIEDLENDVKTIL